MKNIIKSIVATLIISMLFMGCKKWLDVKASDQISDESLFQDADGFRNALNGLYKGMSVGSLYGRDLTWGVNSVLDQDYVEDNIVYTLMWIQEFLYDQYAPATQQISDMWSSAYNVIANANKLISETKTKDSTFFPNGEPEKELILGESLAVRALMHFEMLRLFAPAPINDMEGKYIPYQDVYPAKSATPLATKEVIAHIIADFQKAQELVARNDTMPTENRTVMSYGLQSLLSGSNTPKGGLFFNFRMNRLNYVAIHALMARVYMYANDKVNAKKEAEYVYLNFGQNGRLKWWKFSAASRFSGANKFPKFADDIIFASYDAELINNIKAYRGTSAAVTFKLTNDVRVYYPAGERDYRENLIDMNTQISSEWLESTSTAQWVPQQNMIMPVIRMSEIYYIYSECLFDEGDVATALQVLNEVRNARGRTTTFSSTDPQDFYEELFNEYHREFMEEGQTVFQHKRLNRDIISEGQRITMDNKFVFPIPLGESNF